MADLPDSIPLSSFSLGTLEVMQEFGIDAADHLNKLACTLEDELIKIREQLKEMEDKLQKLEQHHRTA